MKAKYYLLVILFVVAALSGCGGKQTEPAQADDFQYVTEQFADLRIQRYQVPGFEELSAKQKEMVYYLYQAALSGRDMYWDQNFKHNLTIRRTLEAIVNSYSGSRETGEFQKFMEYTKRVWFSNGIHHHYGSYKIMPEFSQEYFAELVKNSPGGKFPLQAGETVEDLLAKLTPILFDPNVAAQKINLDPGADVIATSATNFYENVTQKEVEAYYAKMADKNDPAPPSYGLNSKLVKEKGMVVEKVWKVGGMYSPAIEKIVYWLEKAGALAENAQQKAALDKLIEFYRSGDLRTFNEYCIAWVADTSSRIDVVNGFIEVYGDPLGYRGSYESVVSFKDMEATRRIKAIGDNAQWFEDNSPIMDAHKKQQVTGISAKVITVVVEAGDAHPSTPIGINLPNPNWIRVQHGSKSVSLGNIVHSYNKGSEGSGSLEEFSYSQEEIELSKKYGTLAADLHTDMHEVIGHASGQINEGVGKPNETLKNYSNTMEEARADLVALYYAIDPRLVEIGVSPSTDVGKVACLSYLSNGLMKQLRRLKPGEQLEQAHMRNRQMVSAWVYEKGKAENVIEKKVRDGKTYFVVNDYQKLRELFGQMLREVQRIASEGDFAAAQNLVETYGVKVDPELHREVVERYSKLNIAPYVGFINPKLVPVMQGDQIVDVKVEYPDDFSGQMLEYAREYSFLPDYN